MDDALNVILVFDYINTDGEKSSRGSLQPVSFTVGLTFSAVSALSGISRHLRHEIEANI